MENLKQMTDRDSMEIYLDKFTKAQLSEMGKEINCIIPRSYSKREAKNVIVEFYMFQVLNKMIANRPGWYQYTIDDISTAIEGRSEDGC